MQTYQRIQVSQVLWNPGQFDLVWCLVALLNLNPVIPLRIHIFWNVHNLTCFVLRIGLDCKIVIKMCEAGVAE